MAVIKKNSAPTTRQIEQALATLKALGAKVELPSTSEVTEKIAKSRKRLGFVEAIINEPVRHTKIKIVLGTSHFIAGVSYGPGEVVLEPEQSSLANSLIHQDGLSKAEHLRTAQNGDYSRSYIIKPGNGVDKHHKYIKQEVNSLDTMNNEPAMEVGIMDIAGYNPGFNSSGNF